MTENEHNKDGVIFIGYQGIGKSSVCNQYDDYIDLESSCFRLENGYRPDDWFKYYVNIAFDLAAQGKRVFVSSHEVVRDEIASKIANYKNITIVVVFPHVKLKDDWIDRLEQRYIKNPTKKNKLALLNAKDSFEQNIFDLTRYSLENKFIAFLINEIDYDLHEDYLKDMF